MKNLLSTTVSDAKAKAEAVFAKANAKKNMLAISAMSSLSAGLASVGLGFCEVNANKTMQNFMKTMFNVLTFGGVVLIAVGAVTLIKTIIALASGDQAQPGAIGKGIGLLVGGIILAAARIVVKAVIGDDPTSMTFIPNS